MSGFGGGDMCDDKDSSSCTYTSVLYSYTIMKKHTYIAYI